MKVLLLLNLVFSASVTERLTKVPRPLEGQKLNSTAAEPFVFIIRDCKLIGKVDCNNARDLLSNIGKHLSQQLLIVTPIIVSVKFIKMGPTFRHLYSPTNPISARQIPTYGRAITTNIAATRDGGQLLMFPKAALKQSVALPLDPKEVAHFDIELEFNSQIPWNFSVGEQIGRKEVDFEYWAFNQLIRGMGIVSSLTLHNDPAPFLAPKVFQTAVNSYFEPITAFDSLLFAAKNSIAKVANPLSTFPRYPGTDLEGFLKVVASSKEPFAAGSSLLSFVSSDALFAGEYENRMFLVKSVVLTDPIPLLPLTWTLSQVNGTLNLDFYNKNPESDFALTLDFGRPGLSFRGHLAHIRKSTLIGPNTLRILEHVGYRTFENALPSIFVPNLKFGTPSFIPQDAQYVVETDGGMLAESIFGPPEPNYGA